MIALRFCVAACFFASTAAVQAQEELKLYFGLLHGHTSYSDGSGEPDEAFEMAEEAGVDFLAITEHNHKQAAGDDGVFLTPELYKKLIKSANDHSKPGKFLAIWGQEVSTISAGNHMNIFFADEICNMKNGDFKFLYETFLPDHPEVPFLQMNHPDASADQRKTTKAKERNNDYGIDDYDGDFDALLEAAANKVALIELIIGPAFSEETEKLHQNGKHEKDYLFYLNQGFQVAPSAGQDNHNKTWGVATHARMGIWAKELTREGFIEAIQNRRTYASEDENAEVKFAVNGHPMGSVIAFDNLEPVSIGVSVRDEDEADATYRVRLFYDDAAGDDPAEIIENQPLPKGGGELEFLHTPEVGGYYFVKITQNGDDHDDDIWTAPVWIAGPEEPIAARVAMVNTDDPQKSEIPWEEASDYVGQEVTVTGRVIRSFNSQNNAVFFNFDEDYQNTLNLVLLKSDFEAFGGEGKIDELQAQLMNKNVRIKGEISLYRNERLQLRLTSKNQIIAVGEAAAEPGIAAVAGVEPREVESERPQEQPAGELSEVLALLRELKRDVADLKERVEDLERN